VLDGEDLPVSDQPVDCLAADHDAVPLVRVHDATSFESSLHEDAPMRQRLSS
jgi:hypothetical protein